MKRKIKNLFKNINRILFYQKYKRTYNYMLKQTTFKEYIFKFIVVLTITILSMYLIFPKIIYSLIIAFVITIFYINQIYLNSKKINYEKYLLTQLTIYTSQMSLLLTFNNVYKSLNDVVKFLGEPIKGDLIKVIRKIEEGNSITESFKEFNIKYNNRTISLFNQTLEIFDNHGDSDSEEVLHNISEELNMLKIRKDKFLKYKGEWRVNFYVVLFLCISMPIILKAMIPTIYTDFMETIGNVVMVGIIIIINLFIVNNVEKTYRDQNIGEGGY
ncbi:MAG: DUF4239 domain-containing protein [Clostridia bacterium]|nr:DUF4239 domain-containing protein [Clostridia bacterium]